jgi:hypothetical protein
MLPISVVKNVFNFQSLCIPSQIISHFNFLGESKHLKFDQIYIIT